jgi:hypothetical protein
VDVVPVLPNPELALPRLPPLSAVPALEAGLGEVDPAVCGFEGAPVEALAGAATARKVPPRAASPNTEAATALAMRVLII